MDITSIWFSLCLLLMYHSIPTCFDEMKNYQTAASLCTTIIQTICVLLHHLIWSVRCNTWHYYFWFLFNCFWS